MLFLFLDESKYNCVATTNVCKLRPLKKLRIRLISGHHLPKIAGKIKGNVIQPYVKIKIRGHLVDESEYVTEVVPKVNDFLLKFMFSKFTVYSLFAIVKSTFFRLIQMTALPNKNIY